MKNKTSLFIFKKRIKNKQTKLKDILIHNIDTILKIALEKKQKKKKSATDKKRGRPRKRLIKEIEKDDKAENTPSSSINSDIEEKEGINCRLRSRREK